MLDVHVDIPEAERASPSLRREGHRDTAVRQSIDAVQTRSESLHTSSESGVADVDLDLASWTTCDGQEESINPSGSAWHLTTLNPAGGESEAVSATARPVAKAALVFANSEHSPRNGGHSQAAPVSTRLQALIANVLVFTQRPYDFLEKQIEYYRRKLARQSITVVFQSPHPLSILLASRNRLAFLFILLGFLQLFLCGYAVYRHYRPIVADAFRFTPLELRSGSTSIAAPHVADFLLYTEVDGCLHEIEPVEKFKEDRFFHANFNEDITLAGFAMVSGDALENDPVRFEVSAQRADGAWEVVGYHHNRISYGGRRWQGGRARVPAARGEVWLVDMRATANWPWVAGRVGEAAGLGGGLVLGGLAGLLSRGEGLGRPALYFGWCGGAFAMISAVVGYGMRKDWEEAGMWAVYSVGLAVGTGWCWRRERGLPRILPAMGLGWIAADMVCHGALIGGGARDVRVTLEHGILGGCMAFGGLLLWLLAAAQRRSVCARVAEVREAYAEAWGEVLRQPGAEEALERVAKAAAALDGKRGKRAVQSLRIAVEGGTGTGQDGEEERGGARRWVWWARNELSQLLFDIPVEAEHWRPLSSLDQVFAQATCLNPFLRSKVQEWAGGYGGMFATTAGGLVRWAEARENPEVAGGVKWGQIKAEKRAIEKVIRCYEEDVSRLVDVCRQTMVFATVGELAECLEAIGGDEEVEVVRVKNRLRVEESGEESAGFRNVSLNVRVTTADARSLGVDTHVCEVQLLLADFAKLQNPDRLARYQLFRDHGRPQATAARDWSGRLAERLWGAERSGFDRTSSTESFASNEELLGGISRNPSAFSEDSRSLRSLHRLESGSLGHDPVPSPWSTLASALPSVSLARTGSTGSVGLSPLFDDPSTEMHASRLPSSESASVFKHLSQARLARYRARHCPRLPSTSLSDVQEKILLAFQQLLFRRNTKSTGKQARMLGFVAAMESVSVSSVLFIRRPVHGAGSKPAIRFFLFCIAVAGSGLACAAAWQYVFTAFFSFPTYRFTAVEARNASGPPLNHSIAAFGVATNQCPTHNRLAAVLDAGPTLTVQYHQPVSMNGWWIQTSNASTDLDPVSYLIEGSDDGASWHIVGGSGPVAEYFDVRFTALRGYILATRNTTYVAYSRHSPVNTLNVLTFASMNFTFFPLLVAIFRGWSGRLDNAGLVGSGLVLTSLAIAVLGVAQFEFGGDAFRGRECLVLAGVFGIIGVTLMVRQRYLLAAGIVAMLSGVGGRCVLFELDYSVPWYTADPLQIMLLGVGGLCILAIVIRFHILWASKRMIAGDKRCYDAMWEGVKEREAVALRRLAEVCQELKRSEVREVRHLYATRIVALLHTSEPAASGRRRPRRRVPVLDINQIFAQATLLHPVLLSKVQEWAGGYGGMFATTAGGLVRWAEARENPEVAGGVKWGQIKAEKRAIEKVIRCYEEDVSRLVDVCRQTMVFATVGELAECLEAIGGDEEVEVVRVKNRLRVEESGEESAGFRNVSLNVRVTTEDARSLGVDTHVCEVQLLLADFAKLQKSQGHKRYVRFRNERGE